MKRFNPDSLLVIRRAGGTVDPYGNLVNATYDVRLVDVKTNKTVWRASSRVVRGGGLIPLKERGSTFAVELTNKLKEDQILKACQIIPIQK